eukprot:m.275287 g.275287  ORF g.275287 m.275287 type:complete len:53 (-) comp17692_c0_seq54:2073-2231(-)
MHACMHSDEPRQTYIAKHTPNTLQTSKHPNLPTVYFQAPWAVITKTLSLAQC